MPPQLLDNSWLPGSPDNEANLVLENIFSKVTNMGMWCALVYPDGRGSSADKEAQVAHLLDAFRAEKSGEKSSEEKKQEVCEEEGLADVSHQ